MSTIFETPLIILILEKITFCSTLYREIIDVFPIVSLSIERLKTFKSTSSCNLE